MPTYFICENLPRPTTRFASEKKVSEHAREICYRKTRKITKQLWFKMQFFNSTINFPITKWAHGKYSRYAHRDSLSDGKYNLSKTSAIYLTKCSYHIIDIWQFSDELSHNYLKRFGELGIFPFSLIETLSINLTLRRKQIKFALVQVLNKSFLAATDHNSFIISYQIPQWLQL